MKSYYVFSDECGQYKENRSIKFNNAHPFYVRSNLAICFEDYLNLEEKICQLKVKFGIPENQEIKWAHLGNYIKGKPPKYLRKIALSDFKECIFEIVNCISDCKSIVLFFSLTNNLVARPVNEIKMIKMHLQNMLQRVCYEMKEIDGFATIIVDDLGDKNRLLKRACYSMMSDGDFVNYEKIMKSILIDFSDLCTGLQLADLCAGVFTASLKYLSQGKDAKFEYAYKILTEVLYKKIRYHFSTFHKVYSYGIRDVPNNSGKEIAIDISKIIENKLAADLEKEVIGWFEEDNLK